MHLPLHARAKYANLKIGCDGRCGDRECDPLTQHELESYGGHPFLQALATYCAVYYAYARLNVNAVIQPLYSRDRIHVSLCRFEIVMAVSIQRDCPITHELLARSAETLPQYLGANM
jgi:hypothetical protein